MATTYTINIVANAGQAIPVIDQVTGKLEGLDKLAELAGAAIGVKHLVEMGDEFTSISNKLRVVTDSQFQLNDVMSETFKLAQEARVGWEALSSTYSRIRRVTEDLGLSQKESLTITDTITKALKVGGATTQEAASVMLNLSHAFDEGRLHGRQLNSIMMESVPIQKILAEQLGVSTSQLRQMGKDGQITANVMAQAFLRANVSINEQFGKVLPTTAERIIQLKNEVIRLVGEFNAGTGVFGAIGESIVFVTKNLETLAAVIGAVLIPKVVELTAAALANPIFAGAALIAAGTLGVVTAAKELDSALSDVTDEDVKFAQSMRDSKLATGDFIAAQTVYIKTLKEAADAHTFFRQSMDALKVSSFELTKAYLQNFAALLRVQQVIANTSAMIQVAKIKAATGGPGFQGEIFGLVETYKKVNAEAERLAEWWAQVKKNAMEADEAQREALLKLEEGLAPIVSRGQGGGIDIFANGKNPLTGEFDQFNASVEKHKQSMQSLGDLYSQVKDKIREAGREAKVLRETGDENFDGFISDVEGMHGAFRDLAAEAMKSGDLVKQAFINAFHSSEQALAHFLRTGEFNFQKFTNAILDDITKILAQQILLAGIGAIGGAGASAAGGAGVLAGLGAFANGGDFVVGGSGGTDSQVVMFKATPNEHVSIRTPQQMAAPASSGGRPQIIQVINQIDPRSVLPILDSPDGVRRINNGLRLTQRPGVAR